jgi:hypothetical protein
MKTETNNVVNSTNFESLLKETHETFATNLAQEMLEGKVRNFSVVDLWKMEKTQRSAQNWGRRLN